MPKSEEKPERRTPSLADVDLSPHLENHEYEDRIQRAQHRLREVQLAYLYERRRALVVLEGWDAAGKGGAIRRLTGSMDARLYRVVSTAAPTDEERSHPYLWRFWRGLPRIGRVTVYDRSWYGRVLVERLEGFCSEADWMRAYSEINDFEEQLAEAGAVVVKFWLTITKEEQLRRFREREKTPFKSFKITAEDWRNRKKWGDYERAVCDMIERTSNEHAPWVLIPANDKYFARIEILKSLCGRLRAAL